MPTQPPTIATPPTPPARSDITTFGPFDIVFLDPPYEMDLAETALTMTEKTGLVAPDGVVIAEERWKVTLPGQIRSLHLQRERPHTPVGLLGLAHGLLGGGARLDRVADLVPARCHSDETVLVDLMAHDTASLTSSAARAASMY